VILRGLFFAILAAKELHPVPAACPLAFIKVKDGIFENYGAVPVADIHFPAGQGAQHHRLGRKLASRRLVLLAVRGKNDLHLSASTGKELQLCPPAPLRALSASEAIVANWKRKGRQKVLCFFHHNLH
jgi:hypothetical protein